jgi:hypothetical protein
MDFFIVHTARESATFNNLEDALAALGRADGWVCEYTATGGPWDLSEPSPHVVFQRRCWWTQFSGERVYWD